MATTLDSLSDDILLLLMSEAYLPWYSVLTLATVNRRLRDLNPYKSKSEDDWRLLLYRHGMGRSQVDARAGRNWVDMAKGIAYHCLGCETCSRLLVQAPNGTYLFFWPRVSLTLRSSTDSREQRKGPQQARSAG